MNKQMEPYLACPFNELDPAVLVAYEQTRNNFELRYSSISNAGDVFFTTVRIGGNQVIKYYYGTFLYKNLSVGLLRRPAVHGERSMEVTVKYFAKWSMKIQFRTTSKNSIRIYPAHFCAMQYICDG